VGGLPVPIILFILVALFAHIFLSRTLFGRFIYAQGDNAETARFTGMAVRPLTILEYTLCALIGYIAGLVMASSVASIDTRVINSTLIFDTLLVVVLGGISLAGGRGSIWSVIAGTALIGTLLNGMTIMNLQNDVQNIIKGVVLLGAILLDNRLHPRDEETARQGDL
jgi:ribose transport system permease protein